MLDLDFSDGLTKLNFIGVVSLFGGEIALSALRYSVLIQNTFLSLYVTMILSPGLQAVSLKMFRRMEGKISRAIGGGSDDKKDIIGLSAGGKYKYVGIHSGTKMVISSVLGEALIAASKAGLEDEIKVDSSRGANSPKRNLKLKVIQLGGAKEEDERNKLYVSVKKTPSALLYVIPPITIIGMVITILAEDYQIFALILLNVICNMLVTFTIRSSGIKYPNGTPAKDSPKGDILVESIDGTEMCLVIADESTIQYVFQKPLVMPPNPNNKLWKYSHMLAAYLSYLMVIVNIIWLPFTTVGGQIIFGALIFFGVVQNILLSTFDGDDMLLEVMESMFGVSPVKEYTFDTRSTVIAFCMITSGCKDPKSVRHTLPDTATFDIWFDNVVKSVKGVAWEDSATDGLLNTLNGDIRDARKYCCKETYEKI